MPVGYGRIRLLSYEPQSTSAPEHCSESIDCLPADAYQPTMTAMPKLRITDHTAMALDHRPLGSSPIGPPTASTE